MNENSEYIVNRKQGTKEKEGEGRGREEDRGKIFYPRKATWSLRQGEGKGQAGKVQDGRFLTPLLWKSPYGIPVSIVVFLEGECIDCSTGS